MKPFFTPHSKNTNIYAGLVDNKPCIVSKGSKQELSARWGNTYDLEKYRYSAELSFVGPIRTLPPLGLPIEWQRVSQCCWSDSITLESIHSDTSVWYSSYLDKKVEMKNYYIKDVIHYGINSSGVYSGLLCLRVCGPSVTVLPTHYLPIEGA